jgi:hypothetical protein
VVLAASDEMIPEYVSKPAVLEFSAIAMRLAHRCHPSGHPAGTARVFITFAPDGHVRDARIEGEPIASAPVARCILDHARSIVIPKFEGAPFTLVRTVNMR